MSEPLRYIQANKGGKEFNRSAGRNPTLLSVLEDIIEEPKELKTALARKAGADADIPFAEWGSVNLVAGDVFDITPSTSGRFPFTLTFQ
jgi:hypothetical protein